jgi:hypothetical protein
VTEIKDYCWNWQDVKSAEIAAITAIGSIEQARRGIGE